MVADRGVRMVKASARPDRNAVSTQERSFWEKLELQVNVNSCATHLVSRCVAMTVAICALGVSTRALEAQAPANRFYMSVAGGAGKSGPAQSLGEDQYTGPTVDLGLGMTMTTRGVIGLEAAGWQKDTPFGPSHSLFVNLTLIGYPFGSLLNNLYFQGGAGVGTASFPVHTTATTVTQMKISHPSLLIGLGYDIPIACPIWIAPFIQSYGTFGGHKLSGNTGPNVHESANAVLYHVGVSLKYVHPGPAGACRQRAPALTQ